MIDQKIKLITGSLLHDIGKVVYREGSDRRNHSVSGYDFLKEEGKQWIKKHFMKDLNFGI